MEDDLTSPLSSPFCPPSRDFWPSVWIILEEEEEEDFLIERDEIHGRGGYHGKEFTRFHAEEQPTRLNKNELTVVFL